MKQTKAAAEALRKARVNETTARILRQTILDRINGTIIWFGNMWRRRKIRSFGALYRYVWRWVNKVSLESAVGI